MLILKKTNLLPQKLHQNTVGFGYNVTLGTGEN